MGQVRGGKLVKRHMVDGALNYNPIKLLLDAGLTEIYPTTCDTLNIANGLTYEFTYPTKLRPDQSDDPKLRIDLIFANKALLDLYTITTQVRRGEVEDTLSDHYPILTTITARS
jgi:endonuclease/exonuclease/phosphatase family metal-dependent hydrolase